MADLSRDLIDGLPNIAGAEPEIERAIAESQDTPAFRTESPIDLAGLQAGFAQALHMHQPLVPAVDRSDLRHAPLISNLQWMMEHQDIGDNHNAPVFRWCYKRMGEFIPQLADEGHEPRIMLDYSGTLLFGLRDMGADDVLEALKTITSDPRYRRHVEWLGGAWGHPVAPSTPVQDFALHVRAWQHYFASLFGLDALKRVRGFSPAEMALPNHPDVAYEFVRTLKEHGYQWVLVQEHSVEEPETGNHPSRPHVPHRLVCTNSRGEQAVITAVIKTQGSDTKLVAQGQPYYEAKSVGPADLAGRTVPPLVTQIADGENGGVMMNEFPEKYFEVMREASHSATPPMNVSEYLEHLFAAGVREADLPALQPVMQKRIWDRLEPGAGPDALKEVIDTLQREDDRFHMEGGSWTNDLSWVRGYGDMLSAMDRASSAFHERVTRQGMPTDETRYRNALFHLMTAETSCYRYWGQDRWADYGKEICRRVEAILEHDY